MGTQRVAHLLPKRVPTRIAAGLVGVTLLQLAWIISTPPFRGIDEFDHAFRAASVARGQWVANDPAKNGRGDLIRVPADLVNAASPQCEKLKYPGPDNCNAVRVFSDGTVSVASAASRYNPWFYWVVGTPARMATAADSLQVMRLAAAVLCGAFIGLSAWCISRWRAPNWGGPALLLSLTPVLVYSSVLPAPNGLEMVAGLSLWCALLGLREVPVESQAKPMLLAAMPGTLVLGTVRYLGPAFLLGIVICAAAFVGRERLRSIWGRCQRVALTYFIVLGGERLGRYRLVCCGVDNDGARACRRQRVDY